MSDVVAEVGSIANELCRAVDFWPSAETAAEDFVEALLGKVDALTEAEYNGIPQAAQEWYEGAVEAKNNSIPVPDLPGLDEVVAMNGADKPAARVAKPEGDGEDPKTAAKKKRAAKKKGGAPAEKKQRQLSGKGTVSAIALIMLHNPDVTVQEIRDELKSKKVNAAESVVPTFRSAFRNFMSMAAREGKLHKDMKISY